MRDSRRTRTIVGLLLLVSLTLVVLSLRGGDSSRSGASGLFAPVENAAASIVAPIRNFFSSIGGIGSKDQQIADLQAKIDALQTEANKSAIVLLRLTPCSSSRARGSTASYLPRSSLSVRRRDSRGR